MTWYVHRAWVVFAFFSACICNSGYGLRTEEIDIIAVARYALRYDIE